MAISRGTVVLFVMGLLPNLNESSEKKGVAMGPSDLLCDDFQALNNISWWYDWRMNFWYYHTQTNCTDIDKHKYNHVPMVWSWDPKHPVAVPSNTPAILGFNEPNFHSQANMTAKEAALHWPEIERHSHGRPLVSPAAAPCSTKSKCIGNSFEWFDEFFRLCHGCRVDYLATHAYYCNADTTMDYLQKLYSRYGKKIWLTEFSCPRTMDYGHQLDYMKAILPRLETSSTDTPGIKPAKPRTGSQPIPQVCYTLTPPHLQPWVPTTTISSGQRTQTIRLLDNLLTHVSLLEQMTSIC